MKMFRLHFPSPTAIMQQSIYLSIHPFIHQSILTGSSRNLVQYLLTRLQRLRNPSKQRISLKVFLISWLLSA